MTEISADELVTGITTAVGASPGVETRDVVLVTGPWLAGATSLITVLRDRLPDQTFVETGELAVTEAPKAVVFVAPAVAPLSAPDCALLHLAAANTDLVVGAVSKIDLRRTWRDVLAADIEVLSTYADRYRAVPWVGVAAAPGLGEPDVGELVELLSARLAEDGLPRRNRLRAWECRLQTAVRRCDEEVTGADGRMTVLREQRTAELREHRMAKSERTTGLRSELQQARVQLEYFAQNRCTSVRGELQEDAAAMKRRQLPAFEDYVRRRVEEVVAEVNAGVTKHFGDVAGELGVTAPVGPPPPAPPAVPPPPLKSRWLQSWLMMLLGAGAGAGAGLGLALMLSRLFTNLAPAYTIAGPVAGGVVGLAVMAWVVRMRGLRHDRAVLDRWVCDITAQLLEVVERLVADRVQTAETAIPAELAELDETEAVSAADRVAAIDAELRENGLAAATAAARRDRDLPTLQSALDAVRAELDAPAANPAPTVSHPVPVAPGADEDEDSG